MSMVSYDFAGKTALVTGASSGIGRATALAFGQGKARVAVVDINDDEGLKTVRMIRDNGAEADFFKCDMSDPKAIENFINDVQNKMGPISFAFNNAGIEGEQATTTECSEENWRRVIDINMRGVWLCMKNEIPLMIKNGGGSIVNCSSIAGLVGFQHIPAYVASKHGVIGLTQTAALEYATSNIRINAVCPGVIQTPMIDRFTHGDPAAVEQLKSGEPIGRVGRPEEIAASVLWLCSDQSSFVTGHALVVDGGWVAQ